MTELNIPARRFRLLYSSDYCRLAEPSIVTPNLLASSARRLHCRSYEFRPLTFTTRLLSLKHWLVSISRTAGYRVCLTCQLISKLPGAGPGLTPSGDDLLAGVMLALHRLHHAGSWRRCFGNNWSPMLATRTNAISAAHLGSGSHWPMQCV